MGRPCVLLLSVLSLLAHAEDPDIPPYPRIQVETSHGSFVMELDGPRAEARIKGYEGDACSECGQFTLIRNGACLKCDSCGGTTGCS